MTYSSPGVSYDITRAVSHLGGDIVLLTEEISDGAVLFDSSGDDRTVVHCIERVRDVMKLRWHLSVMSD